MKLCNWGMGRCKGFVAAGGPQGCPHMAKLILQRQEGFEQKAQMKKAKQESAPSATKSTPAKPPIPRGAERDERRSARPTSAPHRAPPRTQRPPDTERRPTQSVAPHRAQSSVASPVDGRSHSDPRGQSGQRSCSNRSGSPSCRRRDSRSRSRSRCARSPSRRRDADEDRRNFVRSMLIRFDLMATEVTRAREEFLEYFDAVEAAPPQSSRRSRTKRSDAARIALRGRSR